MNKYINLFVCFCALAGCVEATPDPNDISYLLVGNHVSTDPVYFWNGSGVTNPAPVGTLVELHARSGATGGQFIQLPRENPKTYVVGSVFGAEGIWGGDAADVAYLIESRDQRTVEFLVRAWRGADTWEEAVKNSNAFIGQSGIFSRELNRAVPLPNREPVDLAPPSFTIVPVPEPSVMGLVGIGVVGLAWARWLRVPKAKGMDGRGRYPADTAKMRIAGIRTKGVVIEFMKPGSDRPGCMQGAFPSIAASRRSKVRLYHETFVKGSLRTCFKIHVGKP